MKYRGFTIKWNPFKDHYDFYEIPESGFDMNHSGSSPSILDAMKDIDDFLAAVEKEEMSTLLNHGE